MPDLVLPNYRIHIAGQKQLIEQLNTYLSGKTWSRVAVLVDENTTEYCWPLLEEAQWPEHTERLEIACGEEFKTIGTCEGIWEAFVDLGLDRHSLLVNLGGGVIGDMGGFAASTYMRGFRFLNIPTTLLAQVDASVGGKLGVDFNSLKNMIGLFADPLAVLISPDFLSTLPAEQMRSGYAEVIKHALIRDREGWNLLADVMPEEDQDWARIIERSVSIKKAIVEADPQEKGLRKILNFGHTIGHAVESLQLESPMPLLHGEAIAIGMLAESWLSTALSGLPVAERDEIARLVSRVFPHFSLSEVSVEGLLDLMSLDKKNMGAQMRFSLLSSIGECQPDVDISEEVLREMLPEALAYYEEIYS